MQRAVLMRPQHRPIRKPVTHDSTGETSESSNGHKTVTKKKEKKKKDDKEPGFFARLFGTSSDKVDSKKAFRRTESVHSQAELPNNFATAPGAGHQPPVQSATTKKGSSHSDGARARTAPRGTKKRLRKKAKKSEPNLLNIDTSRPLEFPTTPEMILAHHKSRPFLDRNEEWLLVELNEYECLVDCLDVIRTIAKHSKFFEIEPDELWEEFFDFVDDVPSYDEVINPDIWQEFRDNKYPC